MVTENVPPAGEKMLEERALVTARAREGARPRAPSRSAYFEVISNQCPPWLGSDQNCLPLTAHCSLLTSGNKGCERSHARNQQVRQSPWIRDNGVVAGG